MTCTAGVLASGSTGRSSAEAGAANERRSPPPLPSYCVGAPPPQAGVGPVMTVRVLASSAASHASVDSSMRAPARTGRTQAKSVGVPL